MLALCAWSGLDYGEAAEALGIPVGTVRSRLSRARKKLHQIHQDLQPVERAPRRTRKHRPVLLAAALTAVAGAAATAVVIGTGGSGKPAGGPDGHTTASLSARQVLLAAASTAERTSVGSGTYWYIKTVTKDAKGGRPFQWESWTRRDGREWFKGEKSGGKVVKVAQPVPFRLGVPM